MPVVSSRSSYHRPPALSPPRNTTSSSGSSRTNYGGVAGGNNSTIMAHHHHHHRPNFRSTSVDSSGISMGRSSTTTFEYSSLIRHQRESSTVPINNNNDNTSASNHLKMLDSVAEFREKYSPANYVPACKRYNSLLSTADSTRNHHHRTVIDIYDESSSSENYRISVADLRRRFDRPLRLGGSLENNNTDLNQRVISNGISNNNNTTKITLNGQSTTTTATNGTRVNNYASYIPVNCNSSSSRENGGACGTEDTQNFTMSNGATGDLVETSYCNENGGSSSPKSATTTVNQRQYGTTTISSNSTNNTNNVNNISTNRKSLEKSSQPMGASGGAVPVGKTMISNGTNSGSVEDLYDEICKTTGNNGTTRTLGLNGLKNIGNTCFMNSVIQCLSNTKPLLEYVRQDAYHKDINTSISSMKGALMKAFAEVIKGLWDMDEYSSTTSSSDRVVNTISLKGQIQKIAPRFIGYAQQDAQEFLRYLLEGLHEDVNRVVEKPKPICTDIDEKLTDKEKALESWSRYLRMDNSRIVDCFVGQLKSTLKCTHCGHCSVTFDPFWDLSLPIPQRACASTVRLSQCLDAFTKEETLDGDEKPTCSKCKERRKCTKSFTIQRFPQILVLHLKRFSPTERYRGKLNVTVDFPLEDLDMSQYGANLTSGDDELINNCTSSSKTGAIRYNLYAVSNHSGTTYSGHYTAYCRHPYKRTWHEYNDSRVTAISARSIVSGEAYVLFYEQYSQKSHL